MTTSRGIVAVVAIFAAITAASFLVGTGAAENPKPRSKLNKVQAILAEHDKRISALEAQVADLSSTGGGGGGGGGASVPVSTDTSPPAHIDPDPADEPAAEPPKTTQPPADPPTTTAAPDPAPATPAPTGGCSYPSGDPPGAPVIDNQRLGSGDVLENFVLRSSGGTHAIMPPNVSNTVVRNGSVYANGGDNIKLGNNSLYENLYLVMSPNGGHLDAMQGQAATGVTIRNVTIDMVSHNGVTGAILFQTLRGGGGHYDITFDINCLKINGTGPYSYDIRVGSEAGATVHGRITNVDMDGIILLTPGGGGTCRIEVDASAMAHIQNNGCELVPV